MYDPELEGFKQLDLREIAASQGYRVDGRESWRSGTVMRCNGDKIIVKKDNCWNFWSVRDRNDHGTVIDFLQRRNGSSIGEIRKELRAWTGAPTTTHEFPPIETVRKDRLAVQFRWNALMVAKRHPYLESRLIPAAIFGDYWRFKGTVKADSHRNAVFGHWGSDGELCGFEMRNKGFHGFSKGGERGLIRSRQASFDKRLLFTESGCKMLAAACLMDDGATRYEATSGVISETQMELITAEINRAPSGSDICAARDADAAGEVWAAAIKECVERANRTDISFTCIQPQGVKDWGDLLETTRPPHVVRMHSLRVSA